MPAPRLLCTVAMVIATVVQVRSTPQSAPPPTLAEGLASSSNVSRLPDPGWPRIRIKDPSVRNAVSRALDGAAGRLATAQCQALFTEFADRRGRPLSDRLTEMRLSATEYLGALSFEDGELDARCSGREGVLAFTIIDGRTIHICGRSFARAGARSAPEVWATIIHELLHSLGLGENPPSPRQITYRVKQLCW